MTALPDPSASFIGGVVPFDRSADDLSGTVVPTPLPVPSLYDDLFMMRATDAPATVAGPKHRRRRETRRMGVAATVAAALLLILGVMISFVTSSASATHEPAARKAVASTGNRAQAGVHPSLHLPAATSVPVPAPPALALSAPVQSHEVFGYAPYWTLPRSSAFDVKNLTTLAYFSVDANGDGTLDQRGPGWNGYQSQDLVDLVTRSHAAGDRVVLTITCFDQHSLDQITSDPNAPTRLAAALITAVKGKSLDGVNFDFEGQGRADQVGLTNLITKVSAALHATNPHWQVTMAVYGSAASDPGGFYNVATVAPAVDAFFVMAYDMNSRSTPSATSPLFGSGYTDIRVIEDFLKLMPPSKILLGLPYYGYDWPTSDGSPTATATGGESPLTYASIAAGNHPTYWDPVTNTPWTAYQVGTQWHKTYFDDPTSLALKAQLANYFHLAGVGIWALGMDNNNPAMLAALLGNAPVVKDILTGPPPGTGYLNFATFAGVPNVALNPIAPPPPGGTSHLIGFTGGIGTSDPTLACLSGGPALPVWSFTTLPGVYVVIATTPTDCAAAMWSFPVPTPTPAPVPSAAPPVVPPPTTTTSHPPTPTTTTSTSPVPTSTTTSTSTSTTTTSPP